MAERQYGGGLAVSDSSKSAIAIQSAFASDSSIGAGCNTAAAQRSKKYGGTAAHGGAGKYEKYGDGAGARQRPAAICSQQYGNGSKWCSNQCTNKKKNARRKATAKIRRLRRRCRMAAAAAAVRCKLHGNYVSQPSAATAAVGYGDWRKILLPCDGDNTIQQYGVTSAAK